MSLNQTAEYVRRMLDGDMAAFSELYKATSKRIYFICLNFLKNEYDANDAVQEIYLTAYKNFNQLNEPEKFIKWLEQIAVNKCRDFFKMNKPVPMEDEELEEKLFEEKELFLPEEYIINSEKRRIVMNIMHERLSDLQYQTILLYYFNNLKVRRIAEIMECKEGAVKNRLSTARAKIKEGVEQYEKNNNDKLYSCSGVPFLSLLFSEEAKSITAPDLSNVIMTKMVKLSTKGNVKITGKITKTIRRTGIDMIKGKIIAGAATAVIAVSGAVRTAVYLSNQENNSEVYNKATLSEITPEPEYQQPEIQNDKKMSPVSETTKITVSTEKITVTTLQTSVSEISTVVTMAEQNVFINEMLPVITETTAGLQIKTDEETETTVNSDLIRYENILLQINNYQKQYFESVKSEEDAWNNIDTGFTIEEILAQRENLEAEIASQIPQDNPYYEQYIRIEPDLKENNYGYTDAPDDVYVGAVAQWSAVKTAYDELFNDLYSDIKSQVPETSFSELEKSNAQWTEDKEYFLETVIPFNGDEAYPDVCEFKAESIKFRCLLLMLYL